MTAQLREIQYLVLPNAERPFLLARVRWPDVYQAISAVRPDWQDDPGLFDLPYAPNSTRLTSEAAAELAAEWGARLPSDEQPQPKGPSLIRRMPSDWSKLSAAERRAWSIEPSRSTRRLPAAIHATYDRLPADKGPTEPSLRRRGRWRRRPAAAGQDPYPTGAIDLQRLEPTSAVSSQGTPAGHHAAATDGPLVIDLTDSTEASRSASDPT